MGFYQNRILPRLIDLSMRNRELVVYRERVLSAAGYMKGPTPMTYMYEGRAVIG